VSSSRPGVIDWFFQDPEHGFLCNFYESVVRTTTPSGEPYVCGSVEAAFQAHKVLDEWEWLTIASQRPSEAKHLGRSTPNLRPDWDVVKFGVMEELLAVKFMKGSTLAEQLLATGDDELIEGTTWCDTIWGVCLLDHHDHYGKGENHLGRMLMERRDLLRQLGSA